MISLTFDDGLSQHLDIAIPELSARGLCGTFYVHLSAPTISERTQDWRRAAEQGHEIGNHTIFHPADARKSWVRQGNALDDYTLDRMLLELEVANQWLRSIDGANSRSFAYPCSNSTLGHYGSINRTLFRLGLRHTRWPGKVERLGLDWGNTRLSYDQHIHELFSAARGGGIYLEDTPPAVEEWNRWMLPSAAVFEHTFEQMKAFIERSLLAGTWGILQFHGIEGGHRMDCKRSEFLQLLDWLSVNHQNAVVTIRAGTNVTWSANLKSSLRPT